MQDHCACKSALQGTVYVVLWASQMRQREATATPISATPRRGSGPSLLLSTDWPDPTPMPHLIPMKVPWRWDLEAEGGEHSHSKAGMSWDTSLRSLRELGQAQQEPVVSGAVEASPRRTRRGTGWDEGGRWQNPRDPSTF